MNLTRELPVRLQPLEDAFMHFRGSASTHQALRSQDSLFADLLSRITRDRVGGHWRALNGLWDKYETGLKHSREGKLHTAEQVFAEADRYRHQLSQTALMSRLVDVLALPSVAYLRYKQARYQEAEALLVAAIDSDAALLTEGFYVLEYHRVQQLQNIARLYFRRGRLADGARMIAGGLRFLLYGDPPPVGNGSGWSTENSALIPAQLGSDMAFQLTSETVGVFLTHPTHGEALGKEAFADLTRWEARTEDEVALRAWFTLKEQYYTGRFDEFLAGSVPFLTGHPVYFDHCKLSILTNLVEELGRLGDFTATLHGLVAEFAGKLKVGSQQRETCSLFFRETLSKRA